MTKETTHGAIQELLNERGLKATPMRMAVLEILEDSKHARSQAELQDILVDFDRVTLYRTLNTLNDKGIIHIAMTHDQDTFYAMCEAECDNENHHHKHIHFKCEVCKKVSCLHVNKDFNTAIEGYQVKSVSVMMTGKCAACLDNI
jgi:Fur family ferric uptake transcriptional regulator